MGSDHEAEIRASMGAHHDLGPEYDDAVAEGLVERIGAEIDKRIEAQLRRYGPPPGPPPGFPGRHRLLRHLSLLSPESAAPQGYPTPPATCRADIRGTPVTRDPCWRPVTRRKYHRRDRLHGPPDSTAWR